MKNSFDIVIIGGGMVGLAMAAALADSKLEIALIEKSNLSQLDNYFSDSDFSNLTNKQNSKDSINRFDLRVSAISPGNQNFLSNLNCWQNIPKDRISDYEYMKVWDQNSHGSINFDSASMALPKLGSIIENQVLRAAIYLKIKTHNNINLISSSQLELIHHKDNHVELSLNDDKIIKAKLLIGADGAKSSVRKKLNIVNNTFSYQQTAFIANVKTELNHEKTAYQRFTCYGPVAFLPLPENNLSSIVWSLDQQQSHKMLNLEKTDFSNKLNDAFDKRLGKIIQISEIKSFPLQKQHATRYLTERCVLIGDAAHSIHPLAGQGVNIGFQDVAYLSQLIIKLHSKQRDFGLKANLRCYERERKSENQLMQDAMSAFKYGFANKQKIISMIRGTALSSIDKLEPLKESIMRRAMGL